MADLLGDGDGADVPAVGPDADVEELLRVRGIGRVREDVEQARHVAHRRRAHLENMRICDQHIAFASTRICGESNETSSVGISLCPFLSTV